MQKSRVLLVTSSNHDVERFIESRCYPINRVRGAYLVATTQTAEELKKALHDHSSESSFCIFEVSNFDFAGDYYPLATWIKDKLESTTEHQPTSLGTAPTLRDPMATRRL